VSASLRQVPLDGFCGLYCGACEVLRAEAGGRIEAMAKVFGMEPVAIHCAGCRSDDVFVNCSGCAIRACASGRGCEFCSDCGDFPCDESRRFALLGGRLPPHFLATMRNLAEIREKGPEEWRRLQGEKWACPSCGLPFSWYADTCGCGRDLDGIKDWQSLSDEDKAFFGAARTGV
jgi:hypothetical protein